MHVVNGRKCEVKKALPRDDESLTSSGRGGSKFFAVVHDDLNLTQQLYCICFSTFQLQLNTRRILHSCQTIKLTAVL